MIKSESFRIHLDWFGQCRTCKYWKGNRDTMEDGPCDNALSPLYARTLWTSDECSYWDTFDEETACEVIDYWNVWKKEDK